MERKAKANHSKKTMIKPCLQRYLSRVQALVELFSSHFFHTAPKYS